MMKGREASTDLETALDQVEGHDGRVRNTTAQDAPEPAEGVVSHRAELAAIGRLCDVREHRNTCACITTQHLTCWCTGVSSHGHTRWLRLTHTHTRTCNRHLTRSRGTTAVCVVPQLRIPPKPQRSRYFCEPNSQLSPSEEKHGSTFIHSLRRLLVG